ncbi:MAG TPA: hypothetical protein VMU40_09505 [Steroidobacteraceae bacterium]|nr:hypothetical protein [Steroidobacteraceae bacterium]
MKRAPLIELAVGSALIAAVAVQPAEAYIDPNSAGPLYQLLFPLLIAVGSAIAALRRYIARAWVRVTTVVVAVVRGERPRV